MNIDRRAGGVSLPVPLQLEQRHREADASRSPNELSKGSHTELREAFGDFVGQTFFSQLLAEMRKSVNEPAYFHGGQAEEIFQGQMDQILTEKLSDSTAEQFSGPMFELFMMRK